MTTDLRRLLAALAVCGTATAGELVGGAVTRSLALTADGLHSLIHVGALLVALWGVMAATDRESRAPGEAATVNALVIVALAVMLAFESVARLSNPSSVLYGPAMLVTAFGLIANLLTALALGRGAAEDLNHRAALLHMLSDAAVAVLALVGLGAGAAFGWAWADPATGLIGAGVLALVGGRLIRRTLSGPQPVKVEAGFAQDAAQL